MSYRNLSWLIALAIVLGALVAWKTIYQPIPEANSPAESVESQTESSGEAQPTDEVTEGNTEDTEPVAPAKRIVHVPDTRKPNTLTEYDESRYLEITGENLAQIATNALDKALDGDMQAAIWLPGLRYLCSDVFKSEASVEEEIQKVMKAVRDGSIPPEGKVFTFTGMEGLGYTVYPTESENRVHLMQWHRACEQVRALWTVDTRKQLEALAREGHVMARYIYANWEPDWELNSDSFSRSTEYQTNALKFSLANLEEGETAGLLAFGQSYMERQFTPFFPGLGVAFMKAALDCGLQSSIIEGRVYLKPEDGSVDEPRMMLIFDEDPNVVLALAEELSEICR